MQPLNDSTDNHAHGGSGPQHEPAPSFEAHGHHREQLAGFHEVVLSGLEVERRVYERDNIHWATEGYCLADRFGSPQLLELIKSLRKMPESYFRQRVRRTGGLSMREDLGIAVATVAIALGTLDRQTASEKAIDAIGYGLGAAMLWQLARWAVRFLFTVPRDLHTEALAERDRALARVAELEALKPITRAEWMEMANQFRALHARNPGVWDQEGFTATWHQVGERETWSVDGGKPNSRRELEALCKQAGAMLLRSPNVAAKLSPRVRAHNDHVARWLELLREQPRLEPRLTGSGSEDGTPTKSETFELVAALSAAVCVSCSAEEI